MKKLALALVALSFAMALVVSAQALARPTDGTSSIAARYASWAGGKPNADSIVNGLRNGAPVTLVNGKSITGFTAQTRMSPAEISVALDSARRTLAGLGIRHPNAEQVQASLVGGEIALPNGKTRLVQGSVTLRAEPVPVPSPVAVR